MRKQLALLTLVAAVGLVGITPAYAVFTSKQAQSFTARVTASGTKNASFSNVALRPIAAPDGAGANLAEIGWTANLDSVSGWQLANAVLRFDFLVNDRNGGIQIYTDNKRTVAGPGLPAANPRFVDPTPADLINPDSNPAGLLLGTSGTSGTRMDMAWSVKDVAKTPGTQIAAMDPNNGATVDAGQGTKFQWLYMLDKQTPAIDRNGDGDVLDTDPGLNPNADLRDTVAFVNGNDFSKVVKFNTIHFGQGPLDYGADADKKVYVYFQANMNQAAPGDVFLTNTLTLEAFID